jgi:hypothetical protein
MENNIILTDSSHNKIYQTYAELKKKIPPKLFKIKVFSSPKYNLDKKPILKKIENDKINPKKERPNPLQTKNKNIYLLSNKTISLKKIKNIKPINTHEYDFIIKKNLLKDINEKYLGNETENYQNFLAGLEDPAEEMEPQHYYFHSNVVNDAQMKNNIYLPKIMDRMRYSIPRNERDKNGFLVEGKALFSKRVNHNDEFKINYEIN